MSPRLRTSGGGPRYDALCRKCHGEGWGETLMSRFIRCAVAAVLVTIAAGVGAQQRAPAGNAGTPRAPAGNAGTPRPPNGIEVPPLGAGPFTTRRRKQEIRVVVHTRGLDAPVESRLAAGRRDARDGARRPAAHRAQRRARSAADRRRARGAGARPVGSLRRRAASAVRDESLRLPELQQAARRAAERARRRARRLGRQCADRRARHLRHARTRAACRGSHSAATASST